MWDYSVVYDLMQKKLSYVFTLLFWIVFFGLCHGTFFIKQK